MAGIGLSQDIDLTDEDEVKEYLNNLGMEYRFGCYSEKKPQACQLLGEFMESISKDRVNAFQVFESNCINNNHPPSCNKAGHYKIVGQSDIEPDPDLGYKYLTQGCDGNFSKSCFLAGMFHKLKFPQEIKTEQNERTATTLFEKACDLDHPQGCFQYGTALVKPGVDQNYTKALKAFEKSCETGHMSACHNLSVMYRKGDGVAQDSALAEQFMHKAQDIHDQMTKERERIKFQEGVETAGSQPLKH